MVASHNGGGELVGPKVYAEMQAVLYVILQLELVLSIRHRRRGRRVCEESPEALQRYMLRLTMELTCVRGFPVYSLALRKVRMLWYLNGAMVMLP